MRDRPFEVPADFYPFDDHWFEHRGSWMHYVDHGEGVPVVMLHGNPTWSFLYRDVIKACGDGVRALAPDLPGFGMSGHPAGYGYMPSEHAEWVGAWIDDVLPDQPFVLVVQDWGGPIGMKVATDRPDRVAGLVVMNTWAWRPALQFHVFSWVIGGPLGWLAHQGLNVFAKRIVPASITSAKDKPQAVFDAYTAPFPTWASRRGTYVFPRAIRQSGAWLAAIETKLAGLRGKPAELVFAMRDPAFGDEGVISKWLRLLGEDTPVTRLATANHYLQEDEPDAIAAAIRRVALGEGRGS